MENITIFSEKSIVKKFSDEFEEILALHEPIEDVSASKKMEYYFEEALAFTPSSSESTILENGIQKHSVSSAEIMINLIEKVNLEECRSSWNKYHRNPCEIIINLWENAPAEFSAGIHIPEGGLTCTRTFYTLIENVPQLSIHAIKNVKPDTKRRIAIFKNLAKKPIGTNILEIQLHLDQSGKLKVECKEIEGEQSSRTTIKEVFSKSKLQITQA